jgi:DNA-binding SARP family transcriptional activator
MEHHGSATPRRIRLLGSLRVDDAAGPRDVPGQKLQSLLTYLALHSDAPVSRELLADLLAPDETPTRSRRLLSDSLYRLQKCLGPGWLAVERETVALHQANELWVDVWAFDRLAAREEIAELQQAIKLYGGDLAPELYDDWLLPERELRRNAYLAALELLGARYEQQGDLPQALLIRRRLILAEPLHEEAHLAYMRLLGRLQRHGEAIHFEYLQRLLRSELDAEPLPAIQALVEALRRERDLARAPVEITERTAFVGRIAERSAALALVEASLAGRGAILALEGEAGIGKSRLLREVAAGARWRGAAVYEGAAPELPDAAPLAPLARALAPLLHSPRIAQLEALLPAETMAALAPLHSPWGEYLTLTELPPVQARARLFNALHLLGAAIAQLKPLVLILDDVQWADSVLWDGLPVLAQSLVAHGALLVLAYRRPTIEATAGWALLQRWNREGQLKTIMLHPLGVDDVAQLISAVPGADPVAVHSLTGGSPFLIGEWLDEPSPGWPAGRSTVERRLHGLAERERAALEAAAVVGTTVPYPLWAETAGVTPVALGAMSEELTRQHWLQPAPAGYSFLHDLTRSAVYERIASERRHALHRSAARAYRSLAPEHMRAYAFHLDQGGLLSEAAQAYHAAARQDLARFAFREAQEALDRALTLMPRDQTLERTDIALALAQVCENTGDRERQQAALDEALAGARLPGREGQLLPTLIVAGRSATHTARYSAAEQYLLHALTLAQQLGDRVHEVEAMSWLATLASEQSKWSEAHTWALRGLEGARATGNRSFEGRALRLIGIVALITGRPAEAVEWFEQGLAVHQAIGDLASTSTTQTNLGIALSDLGAWDRVIGITTELVPLKDALGDRLGAAHARHNQGLAYYTLGQRALARPILERVLQDAEAMHIRRLTGLARNVLGLIAEDDGEAQKALAWYQQALADAEATPAPLEAAYARHDLGALLLKLNQPAEALPQLEAARAAWVEQQNQLLRVKSEAFLGLAYLAIGERTRAEALAAEGLGVFQQGVPLGEQPQGWLWALYRLLLALDHIDNAHTVLQSAYAELQRQANAISDTELRRSFFEHVPLNRAIVAARDALAASARTSSILLARRDAPLGRTLQPDERITVQWTLDAPEDAAITDKAERRRHRLRRLLQQAEDQGGAPTDDDLAQALGVSRRTILRDMDALAHTQHARATRKRKGVGAP